METVKGSRNQQLNRDPHKGIQLVLLLSLPNEKGSTSV